MTTTDLDRASAEVAKALDIQPPRLAVGNHPRGSGYGCAMNLLAWERYGARRSNGEAVWERDNPSDVDPFLRAVITRGNDAGCQHLTVSDGSRHVMLCPECASRVTRMAHWVVDTKGLVDTQTTERLAMLAGLMSDKGLVLTGCTCEHCTPLRKALTGGVLLERTENFLAMWWDYVHTHKGGELAVREAERIVDAAARMANVDRAPDLADAKVKWTKVGEMAEGGCSVVQHLYVPSAANVSWAADAPAWPDMPATLVDATT